MALDGDPREQVGLPVTEFLYTLDQIASIIGITTLQALRQHVFFRDTSKAQRLEDASNGGYRMIAIRILPSRYHRKAEWRIPERELVRYLRSRGLVITTRSLETDLQRDVNRFR